MKDKLVYKAFIGSVHFSAEDEVFYGKIEGVNDLVTFEGETVKKLTKAFKEAVEDYTDLCEESGKEILRSYKGSFNVRVNPELHSQVVEQATLKGKTLNQFVKEANEEKLRQSARYYGYIKELFRLIQCHLHSEYPGKQFISSKLIHFETVVSLRGKLKIVKKIDLTLARFP